jgi:hypothetical protein
MNALSGKKRNIDEQFPSDIDILSNEYWSPNQLS